MPTHQSHSLSVPYLHIPSLLAPELSNLHLPIEIILWYNIPKLLTTLRAISRSFIPHLYNNTCLCGRLCCDHIKYACKSSLYHWSIPLFIGPFVVFSAVKLTLASKLSNHSKHVIVVFRKLSADTCSYCWLHFKRKYQGSRFEMHLQT